jgi:segregation and condensation protein A
MSYKVRLPVFEGPFDLLVYLIEHSEMNIYDIQISEIIQQYLAYIDKMQELNVALSSEFMVLAAELLRIKSRMMIISRQKPAGESPAVEEDPRDALVEKLIVYKECRALSEMLRKRGEQTENVFVKPKEDISVFTDNPEELLDLDIADLAEAFRSFLFRRKRIEETRQRYTRLERERETIENKMRYIEEILFTALEEGRSSVAFSELVTDHTSKSDVVVSFLSVLQLTNSRCLNVDQKCSYGEITVSGREHAFRDQRMMRPGGK